MTGRHGHLPRAALGAADLLAAAAACGAAYLLRIRLAIVPVEGRTDVLPARYLEALPIALTVILVAIALAGGYRRDLLARPPGLADALRCAGLALVTLSTAALLYWRTFQYSRLTIVIAAALLVPAFLVARRVAHRLMRRALADPSRRARAAVVGGGAPAAALAAALEA